MGKVIGSIPILGTIFLTKKASFVVLGFFGYLGLRPFTVHAQSPTPRKKLFYFEKFLTLAIIFWGTILKTTRKGGFYFPGKNLYPYFYLVPHLKIC